MVVSSSHETLGIADIVAGFAYVCLGCCWTLTDIQPNGGDNCMYRHALPPGFVLKKDKKKEEDKETISLEEFIEVEVSSH